MSNVGGRRRAAKSAHIQKRNLFFRNRNPISPEMQEIRALLPHGTPDHLRALTSISISTCQKMVSGHSPLSMRALRALGQKLDADQTSQILIAFFGADTPIGKRLKTSVAVRHARRVLSELKDQDV